MVEELENLEPKVADEIEGTILNMVYNLKLILTVKRQIENKKMKLQKNQNESL